MRWYSYYVRGFTGSEKRGVLEALAAGLLLLQAEGLLKGSRLRKKAVAECMKHIHYEVLHCGGRC